MFSFSHNRRVFNKYVRCCTNGEIGITCSHGLTEDRAKIANEEKATVTIKVDGKKLLWKYDGLKKLEATLIDGEEVDEPIAEGENALSTTKVNGNVVTINSKDKKGKGEMTRVYTFSDSGFVAVITLNTGVKATRHYKRI